MISFFSLPLQVYCDVYPASVPARTAKLLIDREAPSSYVKLWTLTHRTTPTWGALTYVVV